MFILREIGTYFLIMDVALLFNYLQLYSYNVLVYRFLFLDMFQHAKLRGAY